MTSDNPQSLWGVTVHRPEAVARIHSAFARGYRVVQLVGAFGVGKTSLLRAYLATHGDAYPGGVLHATGEWRAMSGNTMRDIILERVPVAADALLVIDEVHRMWPTNPDVGPLALTADSLPRLRYLCADTVEDHVGLPYAVVEVEGFTAAESTMHLAPLVDRDTALVLHEAFGGNPRMLLQAARLVQAGRDLEEVVRLAAPFSAPAVLDPDGRPLTKDDARGRHIEASVAGVTEHLITALAREPDLLHTLHWRKFEELIAELFARDGFSVTLTPPSNDGGVDIYAARSGQYGSFLYVVDCKRWAPDRPVGPALVRQLYGVVERERATHGLLATTSFFTPGAYAAQEDFAFRVSLRDYVDIHSWLKGRS